jgi:DNA-binding response OmpR family regulator
MAHRILLVEADRTPAMVAEEALAADGHRVAWVDSFKDTIRLAAAQRPDLLIAALRLGAYNGLHLLLRLRAADPDLPVVITAEPSDLTRDVTMFQATFVSKPIQSRQLREAVSALLLGRVPRDPDCERAWPRKRAELPATVEQTSARVVELSYGGVRLKLSNAAGLGRAGMEIGFPTLGMSLPIRPRWTAASEDGGTVCGAEVSPEGADAMRHWRWIVDSLGSLN